MGALYTSMAWPILRFLAENKDSSFSTSKISELINEGKIRAPSRIEISDSQLVNLLSVLERYGYIEKERKDGFSIWWVGGVRHDENVRICGRDVESCIWL